MKLVAARGQRDMRDIIPLARRLGVTSAGDLAALVLDVYDGDAIESVHGGYDDLLLHCSAVARVLHIQGAKG